MNFSWANWPIAAVLVVGSAGCADYEAKSRPYPNRPIKLVVPFNAGGASDTFARVMQKAIAEHELLAAPIVIVNRGGAGGTIGSRYVKHRRPDGYTIMLLHQAILTARHADKVEYGPEAFEPIAGTGEDSELIAVGSGSPYESLDDLIAEAQRAPNSVKFAVNLGAPSHFTARRIEAAAGDATFRYVQSGGGADRFAALAGGHVDATIFTVGEYLQFRSAGLRALAVFDPQPNLAIPGVPTARQSGIDVVSSNVQYWWAPRGTPPDRIEVLAKALEKAMETDEVREALGNIQMEPTVLSAQQVRERLALAEQELNFTVRTTTEHLAWTPYAALVACVALGIVAVFQSRGSRMRVEVDSMPASKSREARTSGTRRAVAFGALTFVYAVAFGSEIVGFRIATIAFILFSGMLLAGARLKPMLLIAAIGLVVSLGTHFVMAHWLAVDLP
jgi:tripartite-type tricarboxylate transporter receptor subunit TctC